MSENVDLVRSLYAAWEQGDYFSSLEWAHPEIAFVIADGPEPASRMGLTTMVAGWNEILSAWEDLRAEADEYRELDDQRVLVLATFSGRGKSSGMAVEQLQTRTGALFNVRDGKVTRLVIYWDRDHALADLGLKE
jgi:ketosteroid isomerase-like protein